ncbi:hypothetical protein CBOM_04406 [Ceraceosorus bombacis]|uniref:Uncharacterized protein n=1 Tax=Ceraceosorus bombacis TaxID=401625 RepID=A0A0P1BNG2_9BASI|nr:hypothetical protein CBOM_04406 [Ceraceosorus bombacis]
MTSYSNWGSSDSPAFRSTPVQGTAANARNAAAPGWRVRAELELHAGDYVIGCDGLPKLDKYVEGRPCRATYHVKPGNPVRTFEEGQNLLLARTTDSLSSPEEDKESIEGEYRIRIASRRPGMQNTSKSSGTAGFGQASGSLVVEPAREARVWALATPAPRGALAKRRQEHSHPSSMGLDSDQIPPRQDESICKDGSTATRGRATASTATALYKEEASNHSLDEQDSDDGASLPAPRGRLPVSPVTARPQADSASPSRPPSITFGNDGDAQNWMDKHANDFRGREVVHLFATTKAVAWWAAKHMAGKRAALSPAQLNQLHGTTNIHSAGSGWRVPSKIKGATGELAAGKYKSTLEELRTWLYERAGAPTGTPTLDGVQHGVAHPEHIERWPCLKAMRFDGARQCFTINAWKDLPQVVLTWRGAASANSPARRGGASADSPDSRRGGASADSPSTASAIRGTRGLTTLTLKEEIAFTCWDLLQGLGWTSLCLPDQARAQLLPREAPKEQLQHPFPQAAKALLLLGVRSKVYNPRGFGHCGFAALRHIIKGSEDRWMSVRRDMADAAQHAPLGVAPSALLCNMPNCQDKELWFEADAHPWLAAAAYGRIVVVIKVGHSVQAEHFWPLVLDGDVHPEPVVLLLHQEKEHWYGGAMPMLEALKTPQSKRLSTCKDASMLFNGRTIWADMAYTYLRQSLGFDP